MLTRVQPLRCEVDADMHAITVNERIQHGALTLMQRSSGAVRPKADTSDRIEADERT